MTVGIVGLGLIGGSLAKAYKSAGHKILAFDTDRVIFDYSALSGVTDQELNLENISNCDLLFLAAYPDICIKYLEENAMYIAKNTLVIDCCGTKRNICKVGFEAAEKYGFEFVGGHPMAGTHNSGFKYSRENMFSGAPMVIVPSRYDDMELLERVKKSLAPLMLGGISVTTAEKHDKMIAFTSQMAHIVSNAYVKSPRALEHKGFSAGSYKDLTRVAWLSPDMWTELFMENGDFLLDELDVLIENLSKVRKSIEEKNKDELWSLLEEGRRLKGEIDG
jgi:prephenate dehydrogenase